MKNEKRDLEGASQAYFSALKARPGDKTAIHFLRQLKKPIPKELLKPAAPIFAPPETPEPLKTPDLASAGANLLSVASSTHSTSGASQTVLPLSASGLEASSKLETAPPKNPASVTEQITATSTSSLPNPQLPGSASLEISGEAISSETSPATASETSERPSGNAAQIASPPQKVE